MNLTIEQALQKGMEAHKKGQLQEAERLYRAILQSHPKHPSTNHNLGVLAMSVGKVSVALPFLKTALEANPKIEQFWLSYVNALVKDGQVEVAKQVIEQSKVQLINSTKLNQFAAQINSENTISDRASKPTRAQLSHLLTVYQSGRFKEAESVANSLTESFPEHAFAWKILGAILAQTGRKAEAVNANQKVLLLSPSDPEAHNNLGNILKELGRFEDAEECLKNAIDLKPDFAEAHNNLGNVLKEQGRYSEAQEAYKRAIELKPDYISALTNFGNALRESGRFDEARATYEQALALNPNDTETHRFLSLIKTYDKPDEHYEQMLRLYLNEKLSNIQRCHINFGLAKASEDFGEIEKAYSHYVEGNAICKASLNYDIAQDAAAFEQFQSAATNIQQCSLNLTDFNSDVRPIFILGMPRSGTTLIEQIISAHSDVTGAGELSYVMRFGEDIARGLVEINKEKLLEFRTRYLTELQSKSDGNRFVTDKMPQNFRFIGLIAAAFPDASIIHVKRNSSAVCWANFKRYFVSKDMSFSYDLDDIIAYFNLYRSLMTFWEKSLPGRIYTIDYEALTENPEVETKRLIEQLPVDWDEKCLSPQSNERSVSTASSVQVRKKIYKGSSEVWKNFAPFLDEKLNGLDD